MDKLTYHLARSPEGQAITVFIPGQSPKVAVESHPKFSAIRSLLADPAIDVDEFMALFESQTPIKTIGRMFSQLTERVSAREGKLYFDGDEIHNTVSDVILRMMDGGVDYLPVVRFLEKLHDNPNEHSREQAYQWISSQKLTLTANGDVVGYKGCRIGDNGVPKSTTRGKATVDGVEYIGYIPYPLGSVATMPRSEVVHRPNDPCSTGLHVGTYSYACTFGTVVEVHVNPRDIVSVPQGDAQKMRVCRLKVIKKVEGKYASAVRTTHSPLPQAYRFAEPTPVVDDEFADCVLCETCGECKTHGECICEEAARQQTELDAENAEERNRRATLIRAFAIKEGIDWEPHWSEGRNPVATFGDFHYLSEGHESIGEGEEGVLTAEVVGDSSYRNERVCFMLTPGGMDSGFEVHPGDVEFIGVYTPDEVSSALDEAEAVEGPVDEDGLEPEQIEDYDEEEVVEVAAPVVTIPRRNPTDEEFGEMQARAKRRRQNFVKYAQNTGKWTLRSGDGSQPEHWDVPRETSAFADVVSVHGGADAAEAPEVTDIPEVDGSGYARVQNPSKTAFATLQVKSKTRRRPIRSLVNESKTINWTLIEGDGTKREHWHVES